MSQEIPAQTPETTVETAGEKISGTEDKGSEYLDQLLRLKAEFENYRKRIDREKPELVRFGRAELLLRLLPIYDLLLQAHREVLASHNDTPLGKGMEGIFKEFEKIFKEEGVAAMAPEGKPFDALLHEVLGTVESDAEEGTVIDVPQAGFTFNGKLLRSAKVRVARKASEKIEGGAS